jgi:rRNA maturation protein Nop10
MFGDNLKCPGCNGPYRIIDPKCKECVKRYNKYRYETKQGLEYLNGHRN